MFTIASYDATKPCLLCSSAKGSFAVTCHRNEINGALCAKCLTRIVKGRTEQQKPEPARREGVEV